MDLYIPSGYTPYEGHMNFGVFSTREQAQVVLDKYQKEREYETYHIYVIQLDDEECF
jgi:hypothetical protein